MLVEDVQRFDGAHVDLPCTDNIGVDWSLEGEGEHMHP
jgi:hypothetical protein